MKLKILARMSQKDLRQIFEVLNINKIWKILRTLFTFMPLAIVNIRQMYNLGKEVYKNSSIFSDKCRITLDGRVIFFFSLSGMIT